MIWGEQLWIAVEAVASHRICADIWSRRLIREVERSNRTMKLLFPDTRFDYSQLGEACAAFVRDPMNIKPFLRGLTDALEFNL